MRWRFVLAGAVGALITLGAPPGFAQPSEEMKDLRKEVDSLKEGQKAIQKDLQEIKTLLRARPTAAAPAAPPKEATVSIEGALFRGDKNAKVTLVDFTDYQ